MVKSEYIVFMFIFVWSQQIQILLFKEQIFFLFHYALILPPLAGCVSSVRPGVFFLPHLHFARPALQINPFLNSLHFLVVFLSFYFELFTRLLTLLISPPRLLLSVPPPSIPCCVRAPPHSMAFHRKFNIGSFGVSMNSIQLLPLSAPWHSANRGRPAKSSKHRQRQPLYLVFQFWWLEPRFVFCLFLRVLLSEELRLWNECPF